MPYTTKFIAALLIALMSVVASKGQADIVYDFSSGPITWDSSAGPLTWDADGDLVDDFQISVVGGYIDPISGLYVIDNLSTSSGGIKKTFEFSISAINPAFTECTYDLLGFDFYSEKNVEPGGTGGAGAIGADVFDDQGTELVSGLNVSGSLGSNPTRVDIPGLIPAEWFSLAVDLNNPPNNDDAQIILGNFVFDTGVVHCFAPIPEPAGLGVLGLAGWLMLIGPRRRNASKTVARR